MNLLVFCDWLRNEKNMGEHSSKDVASRLRRVIKIVKTDRIDEGTHTLLKKSAEYDDFSPYVRSQLNRSITLYLEFMGK